MKTIGVLSLFMAFLIAAPSNCQADDKDEIKFDMDHLVKQFHMELKKTKVEQGEKGESQVTMTFEFGENVPLGGETMTAAFGGKKFTSPQLKPVVLLCYFLDEDGVVFHKQAPGKLEGVLSGKKGDSVRITQTVSTEVLAKTKKISFRLEPVAGR